MVTLTATEASRGFSALLDLIGSGETVVIVRDGDEVALVSPGRKHTWGGFINALGAVSAAEELGEATQEVYDWARSLPPTSEV